jgi:hypothetical protein
MARNPYRKYSIKKWNPSKKKEGESRPGKYYTR